MIFRYGWEAGVEVMAIKQLLQKKMYISTLATRPTYTHR